MHLERLTKWFNSSDYRDIMLKGLFLSSIVIFLFLGVISGLMGFAHIFWTKMLVSFLSALFFYSYLKQGKMKLHVLLLVLLVELDSAYVMLGEHVDNFVSIYPYFIIFGFFFFFKLRTAIWLTLAHLLYWLLVGLYGHMLFPDDPIFTMVSLANVAVCSLIAMIFAYFYYISIELSYEKLAHADRQKAILLKEIHHRIKNNLNKTSSLIGLQMMQMEQEGEAQGREVLQKSKLRIEAMAMVHDVLYKSNDFEKIDFEAYIRNLTQLINQMYGKNRPVEIHSGDICLPLEIMMKIGLIINELLTNSIKHAGTNTHEEAGLLITLNREHNHCVLMYHQQSNQSVDMDTLEKSNTLGMKLIGLTIEEMDGEMKISNGDGLKFVIHFSC